MMARGPVLPTALAALTLAAPAWSAAPPSSAPPLGDPIGLALTGPPETVPTVWGAPAMAPQTPYQEAPVSLRPPPRPGDPPAPPPPPLPPPPPTPVAGDQVGGLVVTAAPLAAPPTMERCTTGPAWWRAQKGEAVVWIIGVPDQLPMATVWDDACLRLRMKGARLLITPPAAGGGGVPAQTVMRPATLPLNQRLPAPLWARLSRRLSDDALRARDEMATRGLTRPPVSPGEKGAAIAPPAPTAPEIIRRLNRADLRGSVVASTPLLYAPTLLVARRLATGLALPAALGNPVADRALDLAGKANMFTSRLTTSESRIAVVASAFSPSEADQQACLDKVLAELDAGHTGLGLTPNIDAWSRGDYLRGLLRMNVLNTCPYGGISAAYWSGLVTQAVTALEKARAAGGVTVAVLEFDPMLAKGGILDRLTAAGWAITPPEKLAE